MARARRIRQNQLGCLRMVLCISSLLAFSVDEHTTWRKAAPAGGSGDIRKYDVEYGVSCYYIGQMDQFPDSGML